MKLKNKLTIWVGVTVILIITLFIITWLNINRLLVSNDKIIHTHNVLQHTLLLQKYIERLEINIRNYTLFKNNESYDNYKRDKESMDFEVNKLKKLIWTPSQKEIISEISKKIDKWTSEADDFISQLENDKGESTVNMPEINKMLLGDKFLRKIRDKLSSFLANEENLMLARKKQEANAVNVTYLIIAFSTLIVVIIFIIISYILSNRIIKPINNTSKIMREIANGNADLTKRIPQKSNDEIGQLVHWFNKFIENLQIIVLNIKEETDILDNSSSTFSKTATTLANAAVANSSAMDHMNSAMEDLVQMSDANSSDISNSLTDIREKLIELISFFDTSETDADLIHLKECIESVTETISEIAGNTLLVENFIATIKEISTQSRILAVNASIQANKAGESGKGFSVIASEIKNLSINSDKTIKDVMEIFKRINSLSHRSALNIDKIEHILKEFLDKTSEQNKKLEQKTNLLADMSSSITDLSSFRINQHDGVNNLSSTIGSIKDSSSNNAEGARNMEKASSEMITISKKIKEKIDNFKA